MHCPELMMLLVLAIKDAHVVTGSGADLPKATVVVRDGLIESVGPNANVPADATIIDGSGLTVYPGFIDALSTWGIPGAAPVAGGSARAAGAAPVNPTPASPNASNSQNSAKRAHGPEDRPQNYADERAADIVSPDDNRLAAARAAGFTTAASFPNRGIFEGQGALVDLAGDRGRDMVVAQPIGQQIYFRVGGGGMGRSFPSSLMGNISYVRQMYFDLAQYQTAKKIYQAHPVGLKRPEYDKALEGLAESPRLLLPATEMQQIDRMISFGQELKVPFMLYGLHEGFKRVDELKKSNVPLLISLKWPEKPKDGDPAEIPDYRELLRREQAPALPGMLAKQGVKFAFSSDGVNSALELKKALKKAIDAGLPRSEAIQALTMTPATYYGVSDRLGSIDKGKIANLVVMKGDAFEDTSSVEYVFVDGIQFRPSKELQQPPATKGDGASGRRPIPSKDNHEKGER